MPGAEERYLEGLVSRAQEILGPDLIGIYAGGSWALGDYEAGRSDLDVAAVTRSRTQRWRAAQLVDALRHETYPCPARGLEFVLYPAEVVRTPSVMPGFDLNLNTGATVDERVEFEPVAEESHWFAIDRSILARHGLSLVGPEAANVFAPIPRERLLPVLAEALRWARGAALADEAVLIACRSLHFAAEGAWVSKRAAGTWMLTEAESPELVAAALSARAGEPVQLDPARVDAFLADAIRRLEA